MRKLLPLNHYDENYEDEFSWVANPRHDGKRGEIEKFLIDNREDIEVIGGITDNEASYSYDNWALIKLKRKYYMLATSGCSCPSPSETWRVEIGPATLKQIKKHVLNGEYEGYSMPVKQRDDFVALLSPRKKK